MMRGEYGLVESNGPSFIFGDYPTLDVHGWRVIRPEVLLTFYGDIHSSDKCWAVVAAHRLLEAGEAPENLVGNSHLLLAPELPVFFCPKCGWSGQFPEELRGEHALCGRKGCNYMVYPIGPPRYLTKEVHEAEVRAALEQAGLNGKKDA